MKLNIQTRHSTIGACRAMILLLVTTVFLAGCAESSRPEATGKSKIRGINGIVTSPELIFVIEERPIGGVNFREVAGFAEWDDLEYNFSFDLLRPNTTDPERIATELVDALVGTEHTLLLTGTISNPLIIQWEVEEREWAGTETVFEIDFVHASPLLGQVDVYYALEGTTPVVGNEIATIANGDRIPYLELPEGDYELIVTAPGDPTTIIFQSGAIPRGALERVTIGLFDTDPSVISAVGVNIFFDGGAAQGLADVNSPPQLRLSHAAFGIGNIDGYFNDDFGTAVYSNVAFGELTAYVDTSDTVTPFDVTPTGDPATTLVEGDIQRINNLRRSLFFWGLPGQHGVRVLHHDARPVETFPVLRITDFAANIASLDIYDVEPGTDLDDPLVIPRFGGAIPGISTDYFETEEGMREFVLTLAGETTPISAPLVLDMTSGTVSDVIIVDTADPAVVELRVFDSIP